MLSVGPLGLGIQIKSNDSSVVAKVPALGNARFGLQGDRILNRQSFEQSADNVVLRHSRDHVGIQTLGFGTVSVVQNTIAIAAHHIAFATAAGCHEDAEHTDEDRARRG